MKNSQVPAASPPPGAITSRRAILLWASKLLGCLIGVAILIYALISFGSWSREQIKDDPRHQLYFGEIQVNVPTGVTKETFLEEVRYLAQLPQRMNLLKPTLHDELQTAFEKHPKVQRVKTLFIGSDRSIRIELEWKKE